MIFLFGECELDTNLYELRREGKARAIEPKAFDLLLYLVKNRDRVVTKDEIHEKVWEGRIVSEATLSSCINATRRAIGDTGKSQKFIRTLPRRGFRFIGDVEARLPQNERGELDSLRKNMISHVHVKDVGETATTQSAKGLDAPFYPSIAVLPFTNMSGALEQDHLSDGISEDIITALSKIPRLFVVARNSTFTYKGRAVDVRQVGREQGVKYVLEGSVQRSGERLRIAAQLIDVSTGRHIWAQRYDRVMQDVFELQDEITREVTSALQVELTEGEQARLWASGTKNYEAWETVIPIAEHIYGHRKEDMLEGRRLAKRALQLDDGYASAWTWLGWSYFEEVFNGWSEDPAASLDLAWDAADHSRTIDETNPDTFALLACIHLSRRNFDQAIEFSQKAMSLGPNNAFAAGVAANVSQYCNKPREMVPLIQKAMRLCPIYPAWFAETLSWAYLLMNRHDAAIEAAQDAVRIDPDYIYGHIVLAIANVEVGRREEAKIAVENILRVAPHYALRIFAETQPFRDARILARHIDGLRKAGLPE